MRDLDAIIFAVSHSVYLDFGLDKLLTRVRPGGAVVDVKSQFDPRTFPAGYAYWSL